MVNVLNILGVASLANTCKKACPKSSPMLRKLSDLEQKYGNREAYLGKKLEIRSAKHETISKYEIQIFKRERRKSDLHTILYTTWEKVILAKAGYIHYAIGHGQDGKDKGKNNRRLRCR